MKQCNSIWNNKNTKSAFLFSIVFILKRFSIRPVKDLEESYKYRYFKIKQPHKYRYSKMKEPYKYGYFKIEKPYGYGYFIVKKFYGDIQDRYGFRYLVIMNKLLEV